MHSKMGPIESAFWRDASRVYGFKQSGRQSYFRLSLSYQVTGIFCKLCVFLNPGMILFTYVDDIVVLAQSEHTCRSLKDSFTTEFKFKDFGDPP
jgi:hypothetical protein